MGPRPAHPTRTTARPREDAIKLYPDIALAMLRQERAASGRIWLLLRHLDSDGRGWIPLEQARAQLSGDGSRLRVCGWRQLRNLLNEGEGVFWQRAEGRIWLRSVAKVAAALGVRRLTGFPVAIPVKILMAGIGGVRAHFYASFHSGRALKSDRTSGRGCAAAPMPIARKTLKKMAHISRRTQRNYEKRARIGSQRNFAIGAAAQLKGEQEAAWRRGRALFRFTDDKGRRGPKGSTYLAWQLPNSYIGPHARKSRGPQKRINQKLADLFTQGMTGNDEDLVNEAPLARRFFDNGRLAAKAHGSHREREDAYWRSARGRFEGRSTRFWHHLPGQGSGAVSADLGPEKSSPLSRDNL